MTVVRPPSKRLGEYERPSVAVDTAVLTATESGLFVILTRAHGDLRLPGTFLHAGETLAVAVSRSLETKVGLRGVEPQQLHVFDDPLRDDRGWVLSVAHLAVVPWPAAEAAEAGAIARVSETHDLPFDHDKILARAVGQLRSEYERVADPRRLLGERFTLRDLQRLHEAVAGAPLRRETFRKRMEPQLRATEDHLRGIVGKPPRIYRPRS